MLLGIIVLLTTRTITASNIVDTISSSGVELRDAIVHVGQLFVYHIPTSTFSTTTDQHLQVISSILFVFFLYDAILPLAYRDGSETTTCSCLNVVYQ